MSPRKLQRVITLLALYFSTVALCFIVGLLSVKCFVLLFFFSQAASLFVTVHTKAACSSVLCCRASSFHRHFFFLIQIIVFMKCRAVRKARYFGPFPWITWTPRIHAHTRRCCWEFGFSIHRLLLNASFFQKKQKKNQLGNNTWTQSEGGFLIFYLEKCSYFIFQKLWSFFAFKLSIFIPTFLTFALPDLLFLMLFLFCPLLFIIHLVYLLHLLFPADLVVVVQWSGLSYL